MTDLTMTAQPPLTSLKSHDDVVRGLPEPIPAPGLPIRRRTRLKVADLMATEFPPQQFIVEGLLPVGLCMVAGAPKIGKSWLTLDLVISVALGRPFLNRVTQQGAVLYLALEDSPRRLQERLNRIAPGTAWETAPLEIWTEIDPIDEGGLAAVRGWLEVADCPRVIAFDVWGKFDSRGTGTKDEYARITQTLQPLQAIAAEFGVAVVLIHHTKKTQGEGSAGNDPYDQIMGSRGLTSNMDLTMMLTRTRLQRDAVLSMTGRDVEENAIQLTFDKASCQWNEATHTSGPSFSPEKQLVMDTVSAGFTKATTIAAHLGKSRTSVTNHLSDLVRDGHLVRLGGGEHGLPVPESEDDIDALTPEPADMTDNSDSEVRFQYDVLI
ncbi:AAA family ATPase [Deinococcus aquatilis]|uniref:AAA family ATPase n=1 Tax=Deinococcus aquatilis TaxID=519440 RepID=UPI00036115B1|nr:AAA family ATPase [Deinococcus aquatilis]